MLVELAPAFVVVELFFLFYAKAYVMHEKTMKCIKKKQRSGIISQDEAANEMILSMRKNGGVHLYTMTLIIMACYVLWSTLLLFTQYWMFGALLLVIGLAIKTMPGLEDAPIAKKVLNSLISIAVLIFMILHIKGLM